MTRAVKAKERDTAEGVKLIHSLWPLQRPALRVLGFCFNECAVKRMKMEVD